MILLKTPRNEFDEVPNLYYPKPKGELLKVSQGEQNMCSSKARDNKNDCP